MFDSVLLDEIDADEAKSLRKSAQRLLIGETTKKKPGGRAKKQNNSVSAIDNHCEMVDQRTASYLIRQIRQQSSPAGDSTQRLAHYFTNGLQARLTCSATASYTPVVGSESYSTVDLLRGHQVYLTASPFLRMSYRFANRAIMKLASKAKSIHVVDFGILYKFHWPGLIQLLSRMPGGLPQLRITGIEFPQPGFRPRERVEETMRRLAGYCERFSVPCEVNVISKK